MNTGSAGRKRNKRRLRVGILDLVAKKPSRSFYDRMMNPSYASIMPQLIGVWAEQFGARVNYVIYTGFEDLARELPEDVDILFISAFTPAAYLAYSISHRYRQRGVVTVLGGPHARAYAADASRYFDYVTGFTDKPLIHELLVDFSPQAPMGAQISATRQPAEIPSLRERWKFVRAVIDKSRIIRAVPMIGSLGCPYRCSFCIDSTVDYQPLAPDELKQDLQFLRKELPQAIVGWHDPNFGVRFEDYFSVIEESVRPGELRFVAESSLSLLKEDRLVQLQRFGFRGLTIGIESWFDFNAKADQRQRVGEEKMRSLAEHVEMVTRYIPYVQTNFVWGLDQDHGGLPFELTKEFINRVPAAFPSHSLHTAYGNSAPAGRQLAAEGRVLDVPFRFQDTSSIHNVQLANYPASEFYARMEDLVRHSYSARTTWRRIKQNHHPATDAARWMNLIRSTSQSFRIRRFRRLRDAFARDREFQAFELEPGSPAPRMFRRAVLPELGRFASDLPPDIVAYLEGEGRQLPPLLAPQH